MEKENRQFAVLGMGRFGQSIVKTLAEYDVDVLACDKDAQQLQKVSSYATHVIKADIEDETALLSMGLGNFDVVILATGKDFEASLIATMLAKEAGAGMVIVKARGLRQKKILENIGADMVVLPEIEIGAKIGRELVEDNVLDVFGDSEYYMIMEFKPKEEWIGKEVGQLDIRKKHGKNILAIQRNGEFIIPVLPEHKIEEGDILLALSEK